MNLFKSIFHAADNKVESLSAALLMKIIIKLGRIFLRAFLVAWSEVDGDRAEQYNAAAVAISKDPDGQ